MNDIRRCLWFQLCGLVVLLLLATPIFYASGGGAKYNDVGQR
jgi:hypothetical protein